MLPGLSEHILWIQSIPWVTYDYLQLAFGWIGLGLTIIVYVQLVLGRVKFKPRGVKKNSVPYMIKVVLTNIPI